MFNCTRWCDPGSQTILFLILLIGIPIYIIQLGYHLLNKYFAMRKHPSEIITPISDKENVEMESINNIQPKMETNKFLKYDPIIFGNIRILTLIIILLAVLSKTTLKS